MTDPTGRSFLSYSRRELEQASLIVAAQRDRGIPTWQDVADLPEEPSEEEIRRVLNDPFTANAVVWTTPEVEDSVFIREVELPAIERRARRNDPFFMVPCAAKGVTYASAAAITSSSQTIESISRWNTRTFISLEPSEAEAAEVARRVLDRRVAAIHTYLPEGDPLRISLHTRAAPSILSGVALTIDWSHRFLGRNAESDVWERHLLPALNDISMALRVKAPGRRLLLDGFCSLPAALALGATFVEPAGFDIGWNQNIGGNKFDLWSLSTAVEDDGLEIVTSGDDITSEHLGIFISITDNVEKAVAISGLPKFRAVVRVESPNAPHRFSSAGEVSGLARRIAAAIRQAKRDHHGIKQMHLFLAGPAGLAVQVGQLCNTFGIVNTYEHQQVDATGRYILAAKLVTGS